MGEIISRVKKRFQPYAPLSCRHHAKNVKHRRQSRIAHKDAENLVLAAWNTLFEIEHNSRDSIYHKGAYIIMDNITHNADLPILLW